jgi:hypothetical protein
MKWTNTVETVVAVEQAQAKGQWRIGDAVRKDLTISPGEIDSNLLSFLEECAAKLEEKGYDRYDKKYLHRLYLVAASFPPSERDNRYSWDVHSEAGTPENLKKVAVALRKVGKTVTKYNVRDLIGHWADQLAEQRRKENAKAISKKTDAKQKKAKASADKLVAKTQAEKDEAEERRQQAQEEIDEAKATIRETGMPLPKATDFDVDVSDVNALRQWAIFMGITAHIAVVKREYKKSIKELAEVASLLSEDQRKQIADGWNDIVAGANAILAAVDYPEWRVEDGSKKPRLVSSR